jgi:hypothetical protein
MGCTNSAYLNSATASAWAKSSYQDALSAMDKIREDADRYYSVQFRV